MHDLDGFDFQISSTGNSYLATCTVPQNLKFFEGHFPSNPILPGYVIIDATLAIIKKASKKNLELSILKNAKFMSVVKPLQAVHISLQNPADNQWQATWLNAEEKPIAEFKMVMKET